MLGPEEASMARLWNWAFIVVLAPLFGYALWLRITSLDGLPEVNGDETWHAIQLTRMMRGDSFEIFTVSGIPLSPIHAALELPGLLLFKPSLWVVRLPALISGLAAVILLYFVVSRCYDRTTALIASALLAILPLAIIYSRVSYESSHAPLWGTILLYLAHRLKPLTLSVVLAAGYFVHPTNIFVLPVLLAVLLVRTFEQYPLERVRAVKVFVARAALPCAVVAAIGVFTMLRSDTQRLSRAYDTGLSGRHDFLEFGAMYERLMMGVGISPDPMRSRFFWSLLGVLFAVGLWRLVLARQWGRIAFVGGTVASVLSLFVLGGTNIIQPGMTRYGLFLVVPSVLSVAILARALLVVPSTPWRVSVLAVQCAGLLAIAWTLVLSLDLQRVNRGSYMSPDYRGREETPLTLGSDAKSPIRLTYSTMDHDLKASGRTGQIQVMSSAALQYGPLEWLAMSHGRFRVIEFLQSAPGGHEAPGGHQACMAAMRNCLLEGGYVVSFPNQSVGTLAHQLYPSSAFRHWDIPYENNTSITILRLKREGELGSESPIRLTYSTMDHDLKASGRTGQIQVMSSDAFQYGPLEWLAVSQGRFRVTEFMTGHEEPGGHEACMAALKSCLQEGGYAVSFPDQGVGTLVHQLYPASALRRWDVPYENNTSITILRLKREGE